MTAARAVIPARGATSWVGAMSADGVTGLGPGEKSGGGGTTRRGGGGGATVRAVTAAGCGAAADFGLTSLTYAGFRRRRAQTARSSAAATAPAESGPRARSGHSP